MGLSLSTTDLARYQATASTLLSPFEHGDLTAWSAAATRSLAELFQTDKGALVLPDMKSFHFHVEGMSGETLRRFRGVLAAAGPAGNVYREGNLDESMRMLRTSGFDVWTTDDVVRLTGIPLRRQPMYTEILAPARMAHVSCMGVSLPRGRAIFGVGHASREDTPYGEHGPLLLKLLLPAFRSALVAWSRMARHRNSLGTVLDSMEEGAAIYDLTGRERFRNRSLRRMLEDDPRGEELRRSIESMAREMAGRYAGRSAAVDASAPPAAGEFVGGDGAYSATSWLLPEGMAAPGPAVLVAVAPPPIRLPGRAELSRRFGLTRRESEVALLLARGLSNREIAGRLCISAATARHHAQHVLEKVGVHSRKALALHLLEGSR